MMNRGYVLCAVGSDEKSQSHTVAIVWRAKYRALHAKAQTAIVDRLTGRNLMTWYCTAESLGPGQRYCTCCERDLSGHAVRMLELDQRTQTYHDFEDVPDDKSQGWFPFGLSCAKKAVKSETKRRAKFADLLTDDAKRSLKNIAEKYRRVLLAT